MRIRDNQGLRSSRTSSRIYFALSAPALLVVGILGITSLGIPVIPMPDMEIPATGVLWLLGITAGVLVAALATGYESWKSGAAETPVNVQSIGGMVAILDVLGLAFCGWSVFVVLSKVHL